MVVLEEMWKWKSILSVSKVLKWEGNPGVKKTKKCEKTSNRRTRQHIDPTGEMKRSGGKNEGMTSEASPEIPTMYMLVF